MEKLIKTYNMLMVYITEKGADALDVEMTRNIDIIINKQYK